VTKQHIGIGIGIGIGIDIGDDDDDDEDYCGTSAPRHLTAHGS